MKQVLIYGGGLLGRQVLYLVRTYYQDTLQVVGFIDDIRKQGELVTDDLTVKGSLADIADSPDYSPEKIYLILAIGYSDMNGRGNAFLRAKEKGYEFLNIIHPKACIEKNVRIAEGIIILAGVIIDQFVTLENANYLDIGTLIGENCQIGPNNYFSAGSTVGGSVTIGSDNFFGLNTTITTDVVIGSNNFVNAKTLVYKNIDDHNKVIELHETHLMRRKA